MKIFVVLVLTAIIALASATAIPAVVYGGLIKGDDGQIINLADVDTDGGLSASADLSPIRQARVTCDLLSVSTPWVTVNHAACAARCLAQRHKGGSCRDGVCNCRD